jgi:hypothetical protein
MLGEDRVGGRGGVLLFDYLSFEICIRALAHGFMISVHLVPCIFACIFLFVHNKRRGASSLQQR